MWASGAAPSSSAGDVAFDLLFPRRPGVPRRPAPPSASASAPTFSKDELWTFSPAESASAPSSASTSASSSASSSSSASHGVIGSSGARLAWARVAPEEEEREEEALPAYLSYASASAPALGLGSARFAGLGARPAAGFPLGLSGDDAAAQVEEKARELALALQGMVLAQGPAHVGSAAASATGCDCGPLRTRVGELEGAVQTLQVQLARLLPGPQESEAVAVATTAAAAGGGADPGVSDRISTLEGRQSAFQSQLAQISRVLGVPVGKHGKHSPLKTLVQSLHEAIDLKVAEAMAETQAHAASQTPSPSPHQTQTQTQTPVEDRAGLPMEAVLAALAQEHEASMGRLSAELEAQVARESQQRAALEARVHARLSQQEEWLLQLERELGDNSASANGGGSSIGVDAVAADLAALAQRVDAVEALSDPAARKKSVKSSSAAGSPTSVSASPIPSSSPSPSPGEAAALRGAVQQLQTAVRQLQGELKAEAAALREGVALGETLAQAAREEARALARTSAGLKQLVEKLVRDSGAAEQLLQQYVGAVTHQVASATRQFVAARIRENNRLLDAALRARVPAYADAAGDADAVLLVRTDPGAAGRAAGDEDGDEDDGMRQFVMAAVAAAASSSSSSSLTK